MPAAFVSPSQAYDDNGNNGYNNTNDSDDDNNGHDNEEVDTTNWTTPSGENENRVTEPGRAPGTWATYKACRKPSSKGRANMSN